MASQKKRIITKSKRKKTLSKQRKKVVASPKKKATSKKRTIKKRTIKKRTIKKTTRKRVTQRKPTRRPAPIVEDTIVDVIDEPLPGVMRVTEIEEVSVALPDEGVEEEDKE